ncbi:MAG: putative zinc-binding peptidase [Alphaproteobacteria bacterium]|nr:putative zinc-binding peptidase [Alphaproteobacteria bacterium]MBL6939359.1 putative zinc-binding peptidase [Alphaproteobacteria bacterium]MBL7097160.1 putative zinc-binding peptidase [Alphaproteobacteria bacterium]
MRVFTCQACGQLLYFENIRCEKCGRSLGYLPDKETISAIEPAGDGTFRALAARSRYRYCKNKDFGVCNWMVRITAREPFCAACQHNRTVPDLSIPENSARWAKIEAAKHRLFYSLLRLRLAVKNRSNDPEHGLAFDFLADPPMTHGQGVLTGHDNGLISLAVKEADDPERERVRSAMGEPYRTLLGHFRHEIGHYFWDVLVRDAGRTAAFRAVFGDESQDYAAALQAHYRNGAPPDWQQNFVSSYASAHPWEDFAETWAHYLHIVDTLETAGVFGVRVHLKPGWRTRLTATVDFDPYSALSIDTIIDAWLPLTFAMNNLNRSMGQTDLYPFILTPRAIGKLGFIHRLVRAAPIAVRVADAGLPPAT